VYPVIKIVLVK